MADTTHVRRVLLLAYSSATEETEAAYSAVVATEKGDKISTIGGMHGTITELTDDTVVLRVSDTVKLTFERSAISSVVSSAPTISKD